MWWFPEVICCPTELLSSVMFSSLDSALNSMSTATVNDFQLRHWTPDLTPTQQLVWARRVHRAHAEQPAEHR